jgi:hypothetical protein
LNKNTSSRVTNQPKVIRPERNSNLNCNSSRYSHIPNIKYLDELQFKLEFCSGRMIFGWVMAIELVFFCSNLKLLGLFFDVLWYIDLIFGMWLYLDELQFKFEFRYGWLTFGWVMAIEHVFFVQIWSCPDFSWRPLI